MQALAPLAIAVAIALVLYGIIRWRARSASRQLLRFLGASSSDRVAILSGEKFSTVHEVDALRALDAGLLAHGLEVERVGLNGMCALFDATLSFAALLNNKFYGGFGSLQRVRRNVGPDQHEEVFTGALCLCEGNGHTVALMVMKGDNIFAPQLYFDVATQDTPEARAYATRLIDDLTKWMFAHSIYRGHALVPSLDHMGYLQIGFADVSMPPGLVFEDKLREELESNFLAFVEHREALEKMGIPARRGLLLLGPPGSGKTSTCKYLRSRLPEHTFFVVPSEGLAQTRTLFETARALSPAVIVIEDVDLAVRAVDPHIPNPLMKDLLNELDGLQDRQDVMVVLTSNSKVQLEQALADRPGRIDHTIHYQAPGPGHRKNVLASYVRDMNCLVSVDDLVQMCDGLTPAQLFEVVKKAALRAVRRSGSAAPEVSALDFRAAVEDLGGKAASKSATIRPFPIQ